MTHRGRVSDGTFEKDVLIWVIYQLLAKPAFLYDRWNQCYEIILIRGPYWSKNFISCLDILRFHYTIPSPCFFILKYTIGLCLSHNMLSFLLIINTSLWIIFWDCSVPVNNVCQGPEAWQEGSVLTFDKGSWFPSGPPCGAQSLAGCSLNCTWNKEYLKKVWKNLFCVGQVG